MKVYIKESTLTKNITDNKILEAIVVSVSCYTGSAITFDLLIEESFLYSNINIKDIYSKRDVSEDLLDTLDYNYKCNLNNDCEVFNYQFEESICFIKGNAYKGKYGFTIDMVGDNNMFHFILLDNSQTCLVPNHKISFNKNCLPKNWKKQ